jgi:hypothetical protein
MEHGWFAKQLGDGALAMGPLNDIMERFLAAYSAAGSPTAMAVFGRHNSAGTPHSEVWVYFAPGAEELALELGALPCERPSTSDLSLLAGNEQAWSLLFPDS